MTKRKTKMDRAVAYSRRVAPNATMKLHNGMCICQQCVVRRAWLAGFRSGRSSLGKSEQP